MTGADLAATIDRFYFGCGPDDYFGLGAATGALPDRYAAVIIQHRPDDVAVLKLGELRLVIYLDPSGSSRAGWFARASGRLLAWAAVGQA